MLLSGRPMAARNLLSHSTATGPGGPEGEQVIQEAAADTGRVVLVVDDDEATRTALEEVLMDAGYRVIVAESGRAAIDALRREHVDVLIVDLMMPEMNGWDLASAIRSDPELSSMPILVMTAYGAGVLATAPVASGYFSKPIALDPLLGVLRRTLTLRPPPPGGTQSPTFAKRESDDTGRRSGTHRIPHLGGSADQPLDEAGGERAVESRSGARRRR